MIGSNDRIIVGGVISKNTLDDLARQSQEMTI